MKPAAILLLLSGLLSAQELGAPKALTTEGSSHSPTFNTNGKRVAYIARPAGMACDQLFSMRADGTEQKQVAKMPGHVASATYTSRSGIVFAALPNCMVPRGLLPQDLSQDLFFTRDNGSNLQQTSAAEGFEGDVAWSEATGKALYIATLTGDAELWATDPDGFNKRQLTRFQGLDRQPNSNRRNKRLVWIGHHPKDAKPDPAALFPRTELYTGDQNGRNDQQISSFNCTVLNPTWTPDGEGIVFASNFRRCNTGEFELYFLRPNGGGLKQLTSFGAWTAGPSFSPDGKRLLFVSDKDSKGSPRIFVADWR
jgi:TolB protein